MKPPLFTEDDVVAADREIEEAMAAARGYVAASARPPKPASTFRSLFQPEGEGVSKEFAQAAVRTMWLVPVIAYAIGAALGDLNADAAWLAAPGVALAASIVMARAGRATAQSVFLFLGLHAFSTARIVVSAPEGAAGAVASVAALALAGATLWHLAVHFRQVREIRRIDPDFGEFPTS